MQDMKSSTYTSMLVAVDGGIVVGVVCNASVRR